MNGSSHDVIVARAAEHMISQHGRHAADFADYRSRELCALGNAEAGELWAAVAQRIREVEPNGADTLDDAFVA